MKKYLVLFLLLASFTSFGQFVNYTNINGRYKWIAGKFDSTFTLPSGSTPSLRVGGGTGPGALFYNTSDSIVYQYTGSQWRPLHGSDTGRIQIAYVRNTTASQMTTGQVVYINGSTGNVPTVALAINKQDSTSAMTFGFVRGTIPVNGFGWITTFGPIDGINTNAYIEGEVIYLDSIAGQFTHYKPQAPYHMVTLGYVIKKASNGILFVKIQNGYELEELHNVKITATVLNKSVLIYDSVNRLWVDTTLSAAGMAVSSINTSSATGILGGPITTTGTISADTTLLSTRLWRQKGIDSVTSLINARPSGSGTTNYLSKWTSSSALGNSLVFDNGTNVGIGTNSPAYKLDVNGTLRVQDFNTELSGGFQYVQSSATMIIQSTNNIVFRNGGGTSMRVQADKVETLRRFDWLNSATNPVAGTSGTYFNTTDACLRIYNGVNWQNIVTPNSNGNVLIGTTTDAGYKLDVNGTARVQGTAVFQTANNTSSIQDIPGATTFAGLYLDISSPGTQNYSIGGNGTDLLINSPISTSEIQFRNQNTLRWGITADGCLFNSTGAKNATVPIWVSTNANANYGIIISSNGASQTQDLLQLRQGTNTILSVFNASGALGIGTSTVNASALLDVSSTTKGFLPPRMTGLNAEAIGTPAAGLLVYINNGNGTTITSTGWWGYDGTTWVKLN